MTYEEYKKLTANFSEQELDEYENYINENYDQIRDLFNDYLVDLGYSSSIVSEVDDGRDEFCFEYYKNR